MPRPPRADVGGEDYHVPNRGNGRAAIFHGDADYEAFERVLDEGQTDCGKEKRSGAFWLSWWVAEL